MQLSFKFNEEDEDAEFTGKFEASEVEFLLQFALQTLMQKGLLSVQQPDNEQVAH